MTFLEGMASGLLLAGLIACGASRTPTPGGIDSLPGEPVYRYFAVGDLYQVHAIGDDGLEAAIERLGCHDTPCAIEPAGRVWIIEVFDE